MQITANFKNNLDVIRKFLVTIDAESVFERLLDELFGKIIPALTQFPAMGADFFRHGVGFLRSSHRS